MDLIVDGTKGFEVKGAPRDALDLFRTVGGALRDKGRAVLSVAVNGRPVYVGAVVETLSGKPLSDISRLEIRSEDIAALVRCGLQDLGTSVPELSKVCHMLAEVFQSDSPEDGYAPFERLADIWQTIKQRQMQIAGALGLSLDELELDGVSISSLHEDLNQYLEEAVEALRVADCVTLGDLLEYEIAPRAETEVRIVELLRSRAQEKSG